MTQFLDEHRKHNQVKEQVADILERYPATRNSDKMLITLLLSKYYDVTHITDILKPNIPQLESIRRARQQLQAQGYYPSDKRVEKTRAMQEIIFHDLVKL